MNKEAKVKIRKSLKGRKQSREHVLKRTESFKRRLALGQIVPGMLGKKQSKLQKRRARKANLGNKHGLGAVFTEERRSKIAAKLKGNQNWKNRKGGPGSRPDMIGNKYGKHPSWNKGLTAANDERVLKNARNVLKSVCARPNKFETQCLKHLNTLYPGRFSYTGDGTCIINGRSADAVDLKTRTVVLCNGIYWHLKRHGFKVNESNKKAIALMESEPFLRAGYKVIVLWEDEVK